MSVREASRYTCQTHSDTLVFFLDIFVAFLDTLVFFLDTLVVFLDTLVFFLATLVFFLTTPKQAVEVRKELLKAVAPAGEVGLWWS